MNSSGIEYGGDRFFNDAGQAPPLLFALLVIELSDVMVAVDSVPAIFGVTCDTFLVYSSSMVALLSLALLLELPRARQRRPATVSGGFKSDMLPPPSRSPCVAFAHRIELLLL